MKTITLLTAAMLVTPLAAQEPDLGGKSRVQVHGEFMRPRQAIIGTPTVEIKDQADSQIGFGIRLIGEIPTADNWYYTLGGRFQSSSKFTNKPSLANNYTDTTGIKFQYSYGTVGAGYIWGQATGLNLGVHLEVRAEFLKASGYLYTGVIPAPPLVVDASATYIRPWGRLSLDYAFKAGGTTPFIGFDASIATLKARQVKGLVPAPWDSNTVKSMAPQFAFSVYLGLKF